MCLFLYHHKLKLLLSSSLLSVADNYQSKLHQRWKKMYLDFYSKDIESYCVQLAKFNQGESVLTSEPALRYGWIGIFKWPKLFGSSQMQIELIWFFFKERCSSGKCGPTAAEAACRNTAFPPTWGQTALGRLSPASLLCFLGRPDFTGQAKWPANQKGGDLVPAPAGPGPAQADEEVLWGQVGGPAEAFGDGDLQQGLHTITIPCPVLSPKHTPRGAPCQLWLRKENLYHEAGSHHCTHWRQSHHAALPASSFFPFHF